MTLRELHTQWMKKFDEYKADDISHSTWLAYRDCASDLQPHIEHMEALEAALRECMRIMYMARESDDVMDDHNWSEYQSALDKARSILGAKGEG